MAADDTVIGIIILLLLLSGGGADPTKALPQLTWYWPMPDIVDTASGTRPTWSSVVSQEYQGKHYGQDIMYRRSNWKGIRALLSGTTVDKQQWPPGTTNGSKSFFCPPGTPILAAARGTVLSVKSLDTGIGVSIDHGEGWSTLYLHLETVLVREGDSVDGGTKLGTAGFSPQDPQKLRHLHFAVRYRNQTIFPTGQGAWKRTTWTL